MNNILIFIAMLAFIDLMGVLSRQAGGGLGAKYLDKKGKIDPDTGVVGQGVMPFGLGMLPEMVFAIPFGIAAALLVDKFADPAAWVLWLVGVIGWGWSYALMETGHGVVLQWGDDPAAAQGTRTHKLQKIVNPIANRLGYTLGDRNYCRLFMAVKGFLIALPALGVPMLIFWPLGYEAGWRLKHRGNADSHAIAEFLCGRGAGMTLLITVIGGGLL